MRHTQSWLRYAVLVLGLGAATAGPVRLGAQVGTASISGVVQDTTGAVIPNATVTLHDAATGIDRKGKSNGAGSFSFSSVPSGNYTLTVDRTGFGSLTETAIHLDPGDDKTLGNLQLPVGGPARRVATGSAADAMLVEEGLEEVVLVQQGQRQRGGELAADRRLAAGRQPRHDDEARHGRLRRARRR